MKQVLPLWYLPSRTGYGQKRRNGWLAGAGWSGLPGNLRRGRRLIYSRFFQSQRAVWQKILANGWAFYAAVLLIVLALLKRLSPINYFFKTHRLLCIVALAAGSACRRAARL